MDSLSIFVYCQNGVLIKTKREHPTVDSTYLVEKPVVI